LNLAMLLLGVALPASAQQRPQLAGTEAAVVADHPLAAAAGADVLRRGGNAVDAAVTMAAILAVVQPHRSGLGGDAFLLYRQAASGRVFALNGSGRASERAAREYFASLGLDGMPADGVRAATVPGALRLWADVLRRHGTIGLERALEPAIRLAESGFAVTPLLHEEIEASRARLEGDPLLRSIFLPNGRPPPVGSVLRQQDLARSLRLITQDGPDVLYVGELGQRLAVFMEEEGGLLRIEDLAAHSTLWQEPVATSYLGQRVVTTPPNSQGLALLLQLNMAESFDLEQMGLGSVDYAHTVIELTRLAAADRDRYVADPAFAEIPIDRLISPEYARSRVAALIAGRGDTAAQNGGRNGEPALEADAVFLAVIDAEGNAVAMTQSLHGRFGSGRMVPGTGIIPQSAAAAFSLDPASPNVVAPSKRPQHHLMPVMALRPDGSPLLLFGSAGGDGQVQLLHQVLDRVLRFGDAPQNAVEAPRWRILPDGTLLVDEGLSEMQRQGLQELGHQVRGRSGYSADLGSVQMILMLANGVRLVGADPRREAYGLAW
jgi:gamma-glutamyltranspeptidase